MGWKALATGSALDIEHGKKQLVVKMDDRRQSKFKDYGMQPEEISCAL